MKRLKLLKIFLGLIVLIGLIISFQNTVNYSIAQTEECTYNSDCPSGNCNNGKCEELVKHLAEQTTCMSGQFLCPAKCNSNDDCPDGLNDTCDAKDKTCSKTKKCATDCMGSTNCQDKCCINGSIASSAGYCICPTSTKKCTKPGTGSTWTCLKPCNGTTCPSPSMCK